MWECNTHNVGMRLYTIPLLEQTRQFELVMHKLAHHLIEVQSCYLSTAALKFTQGFDSHAEQEGTIRRLLIQKMAPDFVSRLLSAPVIITVTTV